MGLSLAPVLDQGDIERIHEHSLDLLERVGIDYETPRALEVLEKMGCPVDYERTWASLPRDFVEWASDSLCEGSSQGYCAGRSSSPPHN